MNKNLKKQELPKVIFTDFDGCLTDDRVWLNKEGEEFVAANRKDGLAINRFKKLGIKVVITSTEVNKVVTARATKLGIDALQGLTDKVEAIEKYISKYNLTWKETWYIGNDVNDLGAIRKAKFSICPNDAVKAVKKEVDLKLKTKGGYGVLSELATLLEF
ncbi:MAG: KdsC family phosphatase [Flavobacterium stagni]|jgi:3-deoxy-D-manno-octulosonate 8-phosphate phosphatase (KDO 8-P phosphatase)